MQRQQPLHDDRGEIDDVLHRMHRQPRPRPDLDIAVMQGVNGLVENFRVQQAMAEIKMERMDQRREQQQEREPAPEQHRARRKIEEPEIAIGEGPIGDDFISGDRRHRDDQGTEHVVADLALEQEAAAGGGKRLGGEPERVALLFEDIEIEMQAAEQHQNESHVPRVYQRDPPKLQ